MFIAWITDEKRGGKQMEGLEAVRKEIDGGTTAVVASTLARTEVFWLPLTDEQKTKYGQFFNRRNATEQDLTGPIAELLSSVVD